MNTREKFINSINQDFKKQKPFMGGNHEFPIGIDHIKSFDDNFLKFERQKLNLIEKNISFREKLVYHGTYEENIDNIVKNGLSVEYCGKRMGSHFGKGIYTSTTITTSIYYCYGGIHEKNEYKKEKGDHLLLVCGILITDEKLCEAPLWENCTWQEEYDTLSYTKKPNKYEQAHNETVIANDNRITPLFVVQTKQIS